MCSLGLWGHSISIGYSASIKSSMKGRQRGDIPIPSNPITPRNPPPPTPPPLRTPPSSATYPCPDHQVMKIDLCGRTLRGPFCIGRHPLLSLTLLFCDVPFRPPSAKQFFLQGGGVSLHRKVDLIAPSFIM